MKNIGNKSIPFPTGSFFRSMVGCAVLLVLSSLSFSAKACNRTQLTLDSVVCEGGNYRIYVELCIGGGVTGINKGAADATRDIAFGFFTGAPSISVLNFTPATLTGDSTGSTTYGIDVGPLGSGFNTQATIGYLDLMSTPVPFICVSSTSQCGGMHTQCDQFSFLVNTLPDSIRVYGAEGNGNPFEGCYLSPDMVIDFGSAIVDAGPDTLIARGDTINLNGTAFMSNGPYATSYAWTPPTYLDYDTVASPRAWPQSTTTYTLQASAQVGCAFSGSDSVTITVDTNSVWPGDCNYDLTANYLDMFAIGLAYNFTGPVRPQAGNAWFPHASYEWGGNFASGANHKHADSNGDGIVDFMDAMAIFANYGRTHNGNRITSGNGVVTFRTLPDSAMAGDTIWIVAELGTVTQPEDSAYGIGFQLFYPTGLVDSGSVVVRYDSSWLGRKSTNMITLDMNLYQDGLIEVALTRIDHQDTSGYGEICRIGIAMQDDISAKTEAFISQFATFSLAGGVMVSADESMRYLTGVTDSVLIWQTTLPVSWHDFHGTPSPEGIQLDWSTLVEINADHFQIERAVAGKPFEPIGMVAAVGNSTEMQRYQFLDLAPVRGENTYRLTEKDRSGAETYSSAITVYYEESSDVSIVVAPTLHDNHLAFTATSSQEQDAAVQLYDLQGHLIVDQAIQLGTGTQSFDHHCGSLASGIYLFQLKTAFTQLTYKVIRY